jgi:hypothetical protein
MRALAEGELKTWVIVHDFADEPLHSVYAMSYHWALAQFVGGMDMVQPQNFHERLFAILMVLVTFVMASMVVSSITSMMTRLQLIAGGKLAKFAVLRRYLKDRQISKKLWMRVQRNAHYCIDEVQRNVPESSVELLNLISEPLRAEMHFEEHSPILSLHPLLENYVEENPSGVRRICHQAITEKWLMHGDILFCRGEVPVNPHMYFVNKGQFVYKQSDEDEGQKVGVGDWVAEAQLWVKWIHAGELRAKAESRLIMLEAESFCNVASTFHALQAHPGLYAAEFLGKLKWDLEFVTDIGNFEKSAEMVDTLHEEADMNKSGSYSFAENVRTSIARKSRQSLGGKKSGARHTRNQSIMGSAAQRMSKVGQRMSRLAPRMSMKGPAAVQPQDQVPAGQQAQQEKKRNPKVSAMFE